MSFLIGAITLRFASDTSASPVRFRSNWPGSECRVGVVRRSDASHNHATSDVYLQKTRGSFPERQRRLILYRVRHPQLATHTRSRMRHPTMIQHVAAVNRCTEMIM